MKTPLRYVVAVRDNKRKPTFYGFHTLKEVMEFMKTVRRWGFECIYAGRKPEKQK